MKLIRKLIKISRHLLFILTHINWIGFFKYHKKGSKNVVISNLFSSGRFSTEGICWEFGYINFLIKNKLNFEYSSLKKMHFNKNIFPPMLPYLGLFSNLLIFFLNTIDPK